MPRIILRGVVASVIPACAVAVGSLEACSSGSVLTTSEAGKDATDENPIIGLAMMGFDAAVDSPIIVLAMMGFDAASDAPGDG